MNYLMGQIEANEINKMFNRITGYNKLVMTFI